MEGQTIRRRDANRIRDDAIRVGIRKASTGCFSCAEGYFKLARGHGATDAAIAEAIRSTDGGGPSVLSRRQLLKLVAAGAGAAAIGGIMPRIPVAHAGGPPWWGSHYKTHTVKGTQDFYLYEGGTGLSWESGGIDFTAAQNAQTFATFMYWNLLGPGQGGNCTNPPCRPSGTTPYAWGEQQAAAAVSTWLGTNGAPYYYLTGGFTIFGTIIPTKSHFPNNWGKYDYDNNQNCLEGWLDGIALASGSYPYYPFNAGLYTDPFNWLFAFPQSYIPYSHVGSRAQITFPLWMAPGEWSASRCSACHTPLVGCVPCDPTCTYDQTEVEGYFPGYQPGYPYAELCAVTSAAVGGCQTVIWHYWFNWAPPPNNPCPGQDFDVSLQSPVQYASFFPITAPAGAPFKHCGAPPGKAWPTC